MGLLSTASRSRRTTLACLLLVATTAGCLLVDALVQQEPAFAFSHRIHVEDEGLDCGDCHVAWEDSDDPGMPVPAQCALCHEELDAEKPPTRQVAALFEGKRFRAARAGALGDEIVFSHMSHATRAESCTTCHAGVAGNEGLTEELRPQLATSMNACLACHARERGPELTDCAACHREIRADVAPASHQANWPLYHGSVVRAGVDEAARCDLCHAESSCTTCHMAELPANHTNYWRRRGHGIVASMERDRCDTCHQPDSCDRCHRETEPLNHTGMWGAPLDRHCLACHEPLRDGGCVVCHAGTPSHDSATPLPSDHLPAMNCRMCHGNGQPLPHVDNGQACTTCHR